MRFVPALILAALALVAGGFFLRWHLDQADQVPPGLARANGRIEAERVAVATKYAGRVSEILVKEGDFVTKGTVVARMDTAELLAEIAAAKAKATATDFEAMFLNSMFSQMTSGLKGDGPFGNTPGTGVWRSMLTEQYSKSFAKAGGIGVSDAVFRTLIMQQAGQTAQTTQTKAAQQ